MIDAVSPATGLAPLASRPVKNVCSRTLVGPHSVSYQLWYTVGLGFAGGGPLSRDGPFEADTAPGVSGKNEGDALDFADVDVTSCSCCSRSSLAFEWAKEEDVKTVSWDDTAPQLPIAMNDTHPTGGRGFGRSPGP